MNTPPPPNEEDEYDEEEREEDEDYDISDHEEPREPEKEAEPESKYDELTQQLIQTADEARKRFTEAERQLRDIEREMKGLSESLDKDYGPDNVFAVLEGTCFEYTDNEYVYKMCPFDMSSQRGKH